MTTQKQMELLLPRLPDPDATLDELNDMIHKAARLYDQVSDTRDLLGIEEESDVGQRVRAFLTAVDEYIDTAYTLTKIRIAECVERS